MKTKKLLDGALIGVSVVTESIIISFVLRFYHPVNPMGSYRVWSVYLTTLLLGRLSALSVNQYCAHSFARNWQLPFLNQPKEENDRRKYFMIKSPRKNVADPAGFEPATSWSPVRRASNWATEAGKSIMIFIENDKMVVRIIILRFSKKKWGYCDNTRLSICNVTPLLLDHLS